MTKKLFGTYSLILTLTTFWCGLLLISPLLKNANCQIPLYSGLIHSFFKPICHQNINRSFYIFENPMPVCARCTGIYLGFWITVFIFPWIQKWTTTPHIKYLMIAAIPSFLDFLLTITSIWAAPNEIRALTGFILGAVSGFYILPGIFQMILNSKGKVILWNKHPAN